MSAKATELGEAFTHRVLDAEWIIPENHNVPPMAEPGLVTVLDTDGEVRNLAVKHPRFRPDPDAIDTPGVFEGDIVTMVDAIHDRDHKSLDQVRLMAMEAELPTVYDDGTPANLYPGDRPLFDSLSDHAELLTSTYEIDTPPGDSPYETTANLLTALSAARTTLNGYGIHIDPASARMQDIPSNTDINNDKYVQAVVRTMPDNIPLFVGHGIHAHRELHAPILPAVASRRRMTSYILNTGKQSAPHGFGELQPRLGEILDNDEIRRYDGRQAQSIRYPTRYGASSGGGVGQRVIHSDMRGALSHADIAVRDGDVSNPSRGYGPHTDVRMRFDAPSSDNPDQLGRIETCESDTSAYRLETLLAYDLLDLAQVTILEGYALKGEKGLRDLHANYPELFGREHDDDSIADTQLIRTHLNSLETSFAEPDRAVVIDGTGREVRAPVQVERLIEFALGSTISISPEVLKEIDNSMLSKERVILTMRRFRDRYGLPSLLGYYATGEGTPAMWMNERAEAGKELGFTDEEIMTLGTRDRARAFEVYLDHTINNGLSIKNLKNASAISTGVN